MISIPIWLFVILSIIAAIGCVSLVLIAFILIIAHQYEKIESTYFYWKK